MLDRLPWPLRPFLDWQRRQFFREEDWRITGDRPDGEFLKIIEAESDDGLPLLLTLPKLKFNRVFVGRIRDGRITIKHRTHPLLWPIGPGAYYFSGRIVDPPGGGIMLTGRYQLRPTLAVMYYIFLTLGFVFLCLSLLAGLGGVAAWATTDGGDTNILLGGARMLAISGGYLALGWLHIALEKWLDGRNRRAVQALLARAINGSRAALSPVF